MSKRKEVLHNLESHLDKKVHIKFSGTREVYGVLKGYDTMLNIVLDDAREYLRDPQDANRRLLKPDPQDPSQERYTAATRFIGVVVCRGSAVMTISPVDGTHTIDNPFTAAAGDEDSSGGDGGGQEPVI
eukprot:gb/GECH01000615.1/.p1 GENE.gb/GECH01000615.1/~~gb/GECH01000615.1/.p1  ORF type:complete len:129 (+),score=32.18 gb/GECH01000615.1/:1-387(+)